MMGEHHPERREELLTFYALEALEGEERIEAEALLASSSEARQELEELRRDLGVLALAPGAVAPPRALRGRLLQELEARRSPSRRLPAPSLWLAAASVILCVLGGMWLYGLSESRGLRQERDRLARELTAAEGRMQSLLDRQIALVREIETLKAPGSRHVLLAGLDAAPRATGRTVIRANGTSARFYAFDLPALPTSQDYQLWLIAGGKPVSAGVFQVDQRGAAELEIAELPRLPAIDAWAVTVEPAGGVPQPTGAMVLKS
ncbi:MAG: anti-sigma factor [Thermoanaerobaculia bacterium]